MRAFSRVDRKISRPCSLNRFRPPQEGKVDVPVFLLSQDAVAILLLAILKSFLLVLILRKRPVGYKTLELLRASIVSGTYKDVGRWVGEDVIGEFPAIATDATCNLQEGFGRGSLVPAHYVSEA